MTEEEQVLIKFEDKGQEYTFTAADFVRVEEYCDNECLGIQFLQSANTLRSLVACLKECGIETPYSLDDLASDQVRVQLEATGKIAGIESLFGTSDLTVLARVVAKQTYNFIHKL